MSAATPRQVRVTAVAEGEDAQAWADALRTLAPSDAAPLKREGGASVWRARLLGRDVVIKRWEHRTLGARLKALLGGSRARRQWKGATLLARRGVSAARPLARARAPGDGAAVEWLVLEFVPGRTLIDVLDRDGLPAKARHALSAAVGVQVGEIVSAGAYNRDHKPSNLVVSFEGAGTPRVTVLDTVAIRRCPPGSVRRAAQMLASLHIEPTGLGCGAPPGLRARCVRAAGQTILSRAGVTGEPGAARMIRRLLWENAAYMVEAHGDPTPRTDPRQGRAE